jgi:GntR family transcriptional repressor for pyruvate dehydrogenase complex
VLTQGLLTTQKDVDDLYETRVLLETKLVALCVQRASENDLRKLEELVAEMERTQDTKVFVSLDLQFHFAIADASQNRMLAQLLRTISGEIGEAMTKGTLTGGLQEASVTHRKVLEALRQRKVRKARHAILEVLDGFRQQYRIVLGQQAQVRGLAPSAVSVESRGRRDPSHDGPLEDEAAQMTAGWGS